MQEQRLAPWSREPYRMRLIIQAVESNHTIQARKGCPSTTAAMGIQLLFRQDIPATLLIIQRPRQSDLSLLF